MNEIDTDTKTPSSPSSATSSSEDHIIRTPTALITLTHTPLSLQTHYLDAIKFSASTTGEFGAISTFIGVTRKDTIGSKDGEGRSTIYLDYEGYEEMAGRQLLEIANEVFAGRSLDVVDCGNGKASSKTPTSPPELDSSPSPVLPLPHSPSNTIGKIAITHALTRVHLNEPSCFIVISSSHRNEGLGAVRYVIEELKKRVAIWKCEVYGVGGGDDLKEGKGGGGGVWKKNKEWVVGGPEEGGGV